MQHMPRDLDNRTFIVTGASSGIGKITALELAKRGAHVILACRSVAKAQPIVDELARETGNAKIELVELDLADLASVRRCAEQLLARKIPIHGLVNNAGLAGQRGTTKDGFEIQFGTNHLGHYLFTRLLLDRIKASGPARIINVASHSHYGAKEIEWTALREPTKSRTAMQEYGVSKLANVLFTKELARKLEGSKVTTYALHPGVVATDVWRRVPGPVRWVMKKFMITPEQGAQTTLRCATAPELATQTGRYYDQHGKEKPPNPLAEDGRLAHELWTKSAEWTGLPS
jgi:NAD(P)-dependent dehydrogenase (short-subunit alcohol dehydrogenase family)